MTLVAIIAFLYSSLLVYRAFGLDNSVKAASIAGGILWAPVFFLFWYPFGSASRAAQAWLEYKKMELGFPENQPAPPIHS